METVLIVIHLLLTVALILAVLMQRTAQDGGGLMGGGSTMGGLFTARGSANLLTHTTAILATLFICSSMFLALLAAQQHKARSVVEDIAPLAAPQETPASESEKPSAPAAPEVPVSK